MFYVACLMSPPHVLLVVTKLALGATLQAFRRPFTCILDNKSFLSYAPTRCCRCCGPVRGSTRRARETRRGRADVGPCKQGASHGLLVPWGGTKVCARGTNWRFARLAPKPSIALGAGYQVDNVGWGGRPKPAPVANWLGCKVTKVFEQLLM